MVKVYVLIDSRDNKPFYVGVTSGRLDYRLNGHLNDLEIRSKMEVYKYDKVTKIDNILTTGASVIILPVFICPKSVAPVCERLYYNILTRKGYNLHQSPNRFQRNAAIQ